MLKVNTYSLIQPLESTPDLLPATFIYKTTLKYVNFCFRLLSDVELRMRKCQRFPVFSEAGKEIIGKEMKRRKGDEKAYKTKQVKQGKIRNNPEKEERKENNWDGT